MLLNKHQIKKAIKAKKAAFEKRNPGKEFSFRKRVRASYPLRAEKGLKKDLIDKLVSSFVKEVAVLSRDIPKIIESERKRFRVDSDDSLRGDSVKGLIKLKLFEEWDDYVIADIIETRFKEVENISEIAIRDHFKSMIGVEPFTQGSYISELQKSHLEETVDLISSIKPGTQDHVAHIIEKAVRTGLPTNDAAEFVRMHLNKTVKKVIARSRFIARDQIAKYNANLNMMKNKEIGVTHYEWRSSNDERVRDTHNRKHGKTFSWDDPPADTGHPGTDFQCRCVAIAKLESILDE